MRFLVAFVAAICTTTVTAQIPYLDASNERQALSMVGLEIEIIDMTRQYCSELMPEAKRAIDHHVLKWYRANNDEVDAVWSFQAASDTSQLEAQRAPLISSAMSILKASVEAMGPEIVCGGFAQELASGERNIKSRTPNAAKFLSAYANAHPRSAGQVERDDMASGCVVQHFNNGADLDLARQVCECIADVTLSNLSRAEREEFDSLARADGDVQSLPSLVRIRAKLASCMSADSGLSADEK